MTTQSISEPDTAVSPAAIEALESRLARARAEVASVIFGQDSVIDEALITLLAGGHALLIGLPGLAKTRLVQTLGVVLGLADKRVQFTPDLMPADILGSEVLEESPSGQRAFRFIPGPVFCQLLMADEINRASPRTQSALLQAMQERRVSIAGVPHALPDPFHVLATQNPLEQEGTYPLPEAQLDRFLMQIDVGYPDASAERRMLIATTGAAEARPQAVMSADALRDAQALVRRLPVGEAVVDAILALVRAGRPESTSLALVRDAVAWGPGPRAAQALMLAVRARALLQGRLSPSLDDVAALAPPILRHRMALGFAARADGATMDQVLGALLATLG
ncbi:AAA family ATPase [Paramagnetospirillum marisnigri]|uniref:AAA family ATPase n=1 Tax=Paramagnetospirillum marisnigri TaxID=1285242 RepID=A0A178MZU1_9PROT|nr:MoxR family ATPase [Paramagnetospirillum marisnigri]OAN55314.1 AAA family ATPase [Paramagnetospirillum marisnigri]